LVDWIPTLPSWRWRPTSKLELQKAEANVLSVLKTPYERKMVDVGDNIEINTVKMGSGPPLVLLHGFAAGLGFWVGNLDSLSKNHTVYALDMVGFGNSSRPKFRGKTPQDSEEFFLDPLEKWTMEMGLEKFSLMGHSFGGFLSSCYALRHPNKIQNLILADPWGVPKKPINVEQSLSFQRRTVGTILTIFSPLFILRLAGPYGPGLISGMRPDISRKFQSVLHKVEYANQYMYHTNAQSPPSGEEAFTLASAMFAWAKLPLCDRMAEMNPNIPVTFIYGKHSWMDYRPAMDIAAKLNTSKVQVHVVENAGHHVYIDNHEAFNRLVQIALARK
jgi:pimeloyl-ACP methyl ester carboxylesterase